MHSQSLTYFNFHISLFFRACFAFLCNDRKDFKTVLEDSDISLKDKVAFALRFLADPELSEFIEKKVNSLKEKGALDGMFVVGLTDQDGIDLFSKYVDNTSDVQTAALATSFSSSFNPKRPKDSRVDSWIQGELFRNL